MMISATAATPQGQIDRIPNGDDIHHQGFHGIDELRSASSDYVKSSKVQRLGKLPEYLARARRM